ncbi:MAG: hypothetical protein HRT38_12780 [Alteromonadaceae bacterium]|nr:hypothetical protein [Alteromonadaceae bacterium]
MTTTRQAQKKRSRVKNDITTMQLTQGNKTRLKNIQQTEKFDKLEEALDEVLSVYEDRKRDLALGVKVK